MGIINHYQRYRGTMRFTQSLKDFPFDHQAVTISVKSKFWSEDYCCTDAFLPRKVANISANNISLTEWDVVDRPKATQRTVDGESVHDTSLTLRRRPGFYLKSIISLVFIICVMGWCMYIITPETLNDRLQVSITLFLAQVAFNFVVSEVSPDARHSDPVYSCGSHSRASLIPLISPSISSTVMCGSDWGR